MSTETTTRSRRGGALAALSAVVTLVLLGAPAGLVWSAVAPRPELVLTSDGAVYADPESQAPIAADGDFAAVTGAVGLGCGVVAYLLGRRRGVAVTVGLAAGGTLAALVAWRVGHTAGFEEFVERIRTAPNGTRVTAFLDLGAKGVLVSWPVGAVAAFAVMEAILGRRRRGGGIPCGTEGGQPGPESDVRFRTSGARLRMGGRSAPPTQPSAGPGPRG